MSHSVFSFVIILSPEQAGLYNYSRFSNLFIVKSHNSVRLVTLMVCNPVTICKSITLLIEVRSIKLTKSRVTGINM